MQNYCDFNPRLFKKFTSMMKEVKPAMADDWEIIPESYNTKDGFSLKSAKLEQRVADINLRRFLRFCKEQSLVIEGLTLKGNYIIGKDRSVYTEEMYTDWKAKFEKRTEVITPKNKLELGHAYKTPCGKTLVYLGAKYISQIKDLGLSNGNYLDITQVVKKHLVISYTDNYTNYSGVHELKNKMTVSEGVVLSTREIEEALDYYYKKNQQIACFETSKPAELNYGLVEQNFLKRYYRDYWDLRALFFEANGILHSDSSYTQIKYYGPELDKAVSDNSRWDKEHLERTLHLYNGGLSGFYTDLLGSNIVSRDTLNVLKWADRSSYYGYGSRHRDRKTTKVDKYYRIGLI